jgi:hypothetical protein
MRELSFCSLWECSVRPPAAGGTSALEARSAPPRSPPVRTAPGAPWPPSTVDVCRSSGLPRTGTASERRASRAARHTAAREKNLRQAISAEDRFDLIGVRLRTNRIDSLTHLPKRLAVKKSLHSMAHFVDLPPATAPQRHVLWSRDSVLSYIGRITPAFAPQAVRTFPGSLCQVHGTDIYVYNEDDLDQLTSCLWAELPPEQHITLSAEIPPLPYESPQVRHRPRLSLFLLVLHCDFLVFGKASGNAERRVGLRRTVDCTSLCVG